MRTITTSTDVYQYEELTDEAKEKAVAWWLRGDVIWEWWDSILEDAKEIGLEITSFDISHHEIDGKLTLDIADSIAKVLADHGCTCDTFSLAQGYKVKLNVFQSILDSDSVDPAAEEEAIADLQGEYQYSMLQEYLVMLREEGEYTRSVEYAVDAIEANEYEFTIDGERYSD